MQSSSSETNLGGGTRPNLKRRLDPINQKGKSTGKGGSQSKKDFDLRLSLEDPLLGAHNNLFHEFTN